MLVCIFFFFYFVSDGAEAEAACPPAAVGGGLEAERTRSDRQRGQTRGESPHKGLSVRCAVHGAGLEILLSQHGLKERKQQMWKKK